MAGDNELDDDLEDEDEEVEDVEDLLLEENLSAETAIGYDEEDEDDDEEEDEEDEIGGELTALRATDENGWLATWWFDMAEKELERK